MKRYYTIEITYKSGSDAKMFRITNLDEPHLKEVRATMFISGLYRKIDETTGEIISPWLILSVMVYKQDYFFNGDTAKLVQSAKTNISPKKTV